MQILRIFDREMNHMHQGFVRNVIYAKGASLSLLILSPDLSPRVRPDLIIMSSDGKSLNLKCHCITSVNFLLKRSGVQISFNKIILKAEVANKCDALSPSTS